MNKNNKKNQELESPKFNQINTETNNNDFRSDKYNNTMYFESNYSSSSSKSQMNNSNITFGQNGNIINQDSANNSSHHKLRIYTAQTFQNGNAPQKESTNNKNGIVSSNRINGTIERITNAGITSKNAKNIKQVSNNRNDSTKKARKKSNTQPISRKIYSPKKSDNNILIHNYRNNNDQKDKNIFIQQEEKTKNRTNINIGKELTKLLTQNLINPESSRNHFINNPNKTSTNLNSLISPALPGQTNNNNISFLNSNILENIKSNINEGNYQRTSSQISNINNINPKEKRNSNYVSTKNESYANNKTITAKNQSFSGSSFISDKIKAMKTNYNNPTKAPNPKIENNNNILNKNISSNNNKWIITTNSKNNNINSISDKNISTNVKKDSSDNNESLLSSEQQTNQKIDKFVDKLDVYILKQNQYNAT